MPLPTIVFLTALPLEYDAVIAHLPNGQIETRHDGGATYYVSEYVTPANRRWRVAVRKLSAMGNYEAAQESIDAISDFFPSYMFFVGVAGGIKDVQLGDVVASSMARGYESVKVEEAVIKQRAHVEYPSRQLVELAFQIASQSQWQSKIKVPEGQPKAQVCPIASGEKVITSPEFLKQLLQCCSDAVAVEMEAIGFLRTFRKRSQVQGIVIRGISDMVAGKNPEHDQKWQPIAARHAAGFAWAMVDELPLPTVVPQELPPPRIFAVPVSQRNEYFTGREAILQQLGELLVKQRVVAVHGLGGVGKTQTLVQYAYLHRADYAAIVWMLAASVNDFRSGFWTLAQVLNLPIDSLKQEDVERNVKLWLTTHSDWLLLVDNADELALVKTFVAEIKESGQVLISTRAVATRPVAVPVEVDKMTEAEGAQFLFKRIWRVEQELAARPDYATACQLVRVLDGLPLALEQAAAYIEANRSSFAEYLQDYQRYAKALLARRGELFDEKDHPLPVAATWQASLEKIGQRSPQTLDLLNACAFLSAEGIPEEILQMVLTEDYLQSKGNFFTRLLFRVKRFFKVRKQLYQFAMKIASTAEYQQIEGFKALWAFMQNEKRKFRYVVSPLDSFQLKQLVEPALAYSMLKRDAETKQLFIHRLVQTVLKFELASDTQRQWVERIIAMVIELFPDPDNIQQWATCDRLLPSALTCAELIETYSIKTEVTAGLLNWTAYYLHFRKGEYDQALPLFEKALAIREQVLGPAHPDYAISLHNLGRLYDAKGEYDQALPLFERALAITEQVLGPAHPNYATSLNNLAGLYYAKGEYDQALPLFKRALDIREHILGREHPETNQSLLNLANIYYGQGEYDEALPLLQRALEMSERLFGKQHPFLAQILINLAEVYKLRNDFDKASPLLQRASQISGDQSILQSKASENLEKTKRLQNLGELATMMAHNIKNPVGNIRDRASAALADIREGLFEPNELQPLLENIITQASRLYDIVENFRQFARGNRQKHEPIDCRELVKSMEGFYQGMFQHEKIDFKVEYQESLQYFIYANRFQLQEVLKSLLDNATEAVQNQSNPTVWLKISVVADQIIFSIEDNGKGINLQQREKLFMPFESSKPQGIGFGLYSSYQMVKENGGELKYEQQEGRTCFIVTLPKTEG